MSRKLPATAGLSYRIETGFSHEGKLYRPGQVVELSDATIAKWSAHISAIPQKKKYKGKDGSIVELFPSQAQYRVMTGDLEEAE